MKRIWSAQQSLGTTAKTLHDFLGGSRLVAEILAQRGFRQSEEAIEFLRPTLLNLFSPFCFNDMFRAIERLTMALKQKEKVLVYGDYDVDGVTSTAILYKVLRDLGFQAVAYIPNRQDEGYGLHSGAIERAAKAGVSVLITVDCGITAVSEVRFAQTLGIDVIVTDHHEPPEQLPSALALINPKIKDSGYPFSDLAGVGVAFKLAQALLQSLGSSEAGLYSEIELLDLVALGTIADLVPLVGENRILVYYGLRQMEKSVHYGLDALLEECGLKNKSLKAGQIGFMVAPRINAAGRMDTARVGLELFLTGDPERAKELACLLSQENKVRQQTEKEILAEAISQLEGEPLPRVIVLSAEHWHHGVIGIVASRLVERYFRPVFLIAEDGAEAKGSARGIPGYPVLEQLSTQAHLLTKFGGHKQAAGFSLPTENIKLLREGLNEQALVFKETLFQEYLNVDRQISLEKISADLLRELEQMAPFGFGNPGPVLACQGIPVHSVKPVGKEGSHIKFRFGVQGDQEGIAFRLGERLNELSNVPELDVAFSLDWNTYRGREDVQLMIKDVQVKAEWREGGLSSDVEDAGSEVAAALEEQQVEWLNWRMLSRDDFPLNSGEGQIWFWNTAEAESEPFLAQWNILEKKAIVLEEKSLDKLLTSPNNQSSPLAQESKEGLGIIFGLPLVEEDFRKGLFLFHQLGINRIALADFRSPPEEKVRMRCQSLKREDLITIYRQLAVKAKEGSPFNFGDKPRISLQERVALKVFEELGLIRCIGGTEVVVLEWIPAQHKLNLESSLRFRSAQERFERALKFQRELLGSALG